MSCQTRVTFIHSRLSSSLPRLSFWKTTLTDFHVLCTFPLLISTCRFHARASSSLKYFSHFKSGSCVGSVSWETGSTISSVLISQSTFRKKRRSLKKVLHLHRLALERLPKSVRLHRRVCKMECNRNGCLQRLWRRRRGPRAHAFRYRCGAQRFGSTVHN